MKTKQAEKRECGRCDNEATKQTVRGKQNQERGGLPQNDGWFCDECWEKGLKLEHEAMYG